MKCQRARSDGNPCGNYAVRGTNLCRKHGGMSKQVRRKAIVRAELSAWGLTDEHVDPGETLLRLVAQSARRAALYSDLLRRAYEDDPSFPDAFAGANVAALIGHKYALTKEVIGSRSRRLSAGWWSWRPRSGTDVPGSASWRLMRDWRSVGSGWLRSRVR